MSEGIEPRLISAQELNNIICDMGKQIGNLNRQVHDYKTAYENEFKNSQSIIKSLRLENRNLSQAYLEAITTNGWCGQRVTKISGDYSFDGIVVAAFQKRSGKWRLVVENDQGILHIFNINQVSFRTVQSTPAVNPPASEVPPASS